MIKVLRRGEFFLFETKQNNKVLYLDHKPYIWLHIPTIGLVLETTAKLHKADHTLACGKYRIYEVKDEPQLVDQLHLELFIGDGRWQGYLLLSGLPTQKHRRARIIPTREVISNRTRAFA